MSAALAVVIPSYNRLDRLRDCLDSVIAHAPPGTEILVVDDASPDSAVSRLVATFPAARCLRLARRRGFCFAVNSGIAATTAPIVETLNDDTRVTAGWADAPLRQFDDPVVAAVAPLVIGPDGRIDSAGDQYDPGGFARKIGHGEALSPRYLVRRTVFGASGSSAFYRRSSLERVGAFPEAFGAYFDDVDLAFRLHRTGGRIVFEPASRVVHHGGSSYGPPLDDLLAKQSCNEERVFWRNLPTRDLLRSLPRHAAVLAGKAARRWRERRVGPWLKGRFKAWAAIPADRRHQRRLAKLDPAGRLCDWQVGSIAMDEVADCNLESLG